MQSDGGGGRVCPRGASRYIWQAGDTPASVALRFGTTEQALRLANEYTVFDQLLPGDVVCVPPDQLTCVSGERYVVRAEDTFLSIAERFGISTLELAERNPFVSPSALTAGQVLCVPAPGAGADCPAGYGFGVTRLGQSYTDILLEKDLSDEAFRAANPDLSPDHLPAGQRYCVPPPRARNLCAGGGARYILGPGEALASVARRFGLTSGQLLLLNPSLSPSDFIPGRVVCVS